MRLLFACVLLLASAAPRAAAPIRVMILDGGRAGAYHAFKPDFRKYAAVVEWAAAGRVTQAVPSDFPTPETIRVRPHTP